MSDAIWPTIRLRLGEITLWLAAAAVLAIVAIALAWESKSDHYLDVSFPENASYESSGKIVARLAPRDRETPVAADAEFVLFTTTAMRPDEGVAVGAVKELWRKNADSRGLVVADLPPWEELVQIDPSDSSINLVLEAKFDGHKHYWRKSYSRPKRAQLFVTLDRPLYQPGQTVDARVLAVSPTSGKPTESELKWSIYDPQDNLVKQVDATTSEMGISSISFPLAANGLQGSYRIEVAAGRDTREVTFEVRPYRLPRFSVDVEFDEPIVEAGQAATGRVVATYTYGEPVAAEDVSVIVETPGAEDVVLAGKTDLQGRFEFVADTAALVQGGVVSVSATVKTAAGRMERGRGTIGVRSGQASKSWVIELVPARKPFFEAYRANSGYVRLTRGGEPVSGVRVKLYLPEDDTERDVVVTTDQDGLARFEWNPESAGVGVTALILSGQGEVRRELSPPIRSSGPLLGVRDVTFTAGDEVEVDVPAELTEEERETLVALKKDDQIVAVGEVDDASVGRVMLPAGARGLYDLVIVWWDRTGTLTIADDIAVPVWVAQAGGSEVAVGFDREEYRPGANGVVTMNFPAKVGDAEPAKVAYGLVAVDEALYELEERPTQALHLAISESPETIAKVSAALPKLEQTADASAAARDVAIAEYLQALNRSSDAYYSRNDNGRDITRDVNRRLGHLPRATFVALCLALLLVFLGLTIRATVSSFRSKKTFNMKRVAAQFGLVVASTVVAAAFVGVGGEEGFAGGAAMWVIVSVGWIAAAGWRSRGDTELFAWTLLTLGGVWVWGCALVAGYRVFDAHGDFGSAFIIIGSAVPGVLWLLQAGAWGLIMLREREWAAATALTSFAAAFVASPFLMFTSGMSSEKAYYKRDDAQLEMASFAEESIAPAAPMGGGAAPADLESEPLPARKQKALVDIGLAAEPKPESGPRVRSWFPETMVWVAELIADDTGKAELPITFPDSITTWRFDVWANTSDGRFGSGQASVRTIQTFFAEVELPTHLIGGDVIEVPVTLSNRSQEPVMAKLSAVGDGGLRVRRGPPGQIVVAPEQRALVKLTVVADKPGAGAITVTAAADDAPGGGDAVRREVQIAPDGAVLTKSDSGIVADGFRVDVDIPLSALPNTARVDVGLYPSLMADAVAGLDSMLREPMGCFEQTSSANYPNVLVLKTLQATKPNVWPDGPEAWNEANLEAQRFVDLGYQKMIAFQKAGGGFALYPSSDEADPMLTAYGLMQLAEMRDVTTVDDQVARRAVRWLELHQNQNGSWPAWADRAAGGSWRSDGDPGQVRSTSFILMGVLPWRDQLRERRTIERALDRIEERLPSAKAPDAIAYAANALMMAGREDAARAALGRLSSSATRQEGKMWWASSGSSWMGARGGYADVETTAVAGWAIVELGDKPDWSRGVLQFLAESRRGGGGWGSTQATVWTLRTFQKLRALDDGEVEVTLKLDDESLRRSGGEGSDGVARVGGDRAPLLHRFESGLATGTSELVIQPVGGASTTAMVQATSTWAVPWDSRDAAAASGPFVLDWRVTDRSFELGKPVEIVATVENPGPDWGVNVIVELPIPPGAFVDLDTVRERFAADNVELLPTHIRAYIDEMPPGSRQVFAYTFVPMVRGQMSMPPLRAYPFYARNPTSELDAGDVRTR